MEKTPEQLLRELDEERQIVLRYLALQKKRNNGVQQPVAPPVVKDKSNADDTKRTGLKAAVRAFLAIQTAGVDRSEIAAGIIGQFENETIESILPKISGVLSTDKDLEKPAFESKLKAGSKRDKVWTIKKKKGAETP